LYQNYPNPFNPVTNIEYTLLRPEHVRLDVFDITGGEVVEIVEARQAAGRYKVAFDASRLASGIYFYRLQAGDFSRVRTMVLLK
jgi:hypothetical protein